MEMVKLESLDDWENLPMTKWKIKQPRLSEKRPNALETGNESCLLINSNNFSGCSLNKATIVLFTNRP